MVEVFFDEEFVFFDMGFVFFDEEFVLDEEENEAPSSPGMLRVLDCSNGSATRPGI